MPLSKTDYPLFCLKKSPSNLNKNANEISNKLSIRERIIIIYFDIRASAVSAPAVSYGLIRKNWLKFK